MKEQLKTLDTDLRTKTANDAALQETIDRLDTVPGIAPLTAQRLAIWLPELGTISAKQVAALVGVAPYPQQSGQAKGRRIILGGRSGLRHALYVPVLTLVRRDPTFQAHCRQLRTHGKAHKVAIIACMRRLLGILTVMLKDGLNWEDTNVGQGVFLSDMH